MVAKNQIILEESREEVIDDLPKEVSAASVENNITVNNGMLQEKLIALKNKLAESSGEKMTPRIVEKKTHSINFGVIGSGQAGSRLAECFNALGYDSVAINTAQQDLEHINIPDGNKLFTSFGMGGAGKDLEIGREAAEAHRDAINELVSSKLSNCDIFLFCTSLGGGSGAGSVETIIDILSAHGKPIAVITILPMSSEDSQTKNNALQTLVKLTKLTKSNIVNNLIVVDNAKIEMIYSDVSQLDFFNVSNKAIVEPLDIFNTLTSRASSVKSLDPTELAKIFVDGGGLCVYGSMSVANYQEDTAIAESVISNLNSNLLSAGFNLKQSQYVGVMIVASKKVWDKIPAASINYATSMIGDLCGSPKGVYKGIYTVDSDEDVVKVYSIFSGLGLPGDRVDQLKKEAQEYVAKIKEKDEVRNLSLKLDSGTEDTVSQADRIKQKIAQKSSAFGKLNKSVIDRRK